MSEYSDCLTALPSTFVHCSNGTEPRYLTRLARISMEQLNRNLPALTGEAGNSATRNVSSLTDDTQMSRLGCVDARVSVSR